MPYPYGKNAQGLKPVREVEYEEDGPEDPKEPTIQRKLEEALDHLDELGGLLSSMRSNLFGEGEDGAKCEARCTNIDSLAIDISRRSANFVDQVKGILNRL